MKRKPQPQSGIRASFATAFGNWRRKQHLPLKKVASDLGVSTSTVNSWELGGRFPSGAKFDEIAVYTGLEPCKLFCLQAERCVGSECALKGSQGAVQGP